MLRETGTSVMVFARSAFGVRHAWHPFQVADRVRGYLNAAVDQSPLGTRHAGRLLRLTENHQIWRFHNTAQPCIMSVDPNTLSYGPDRCPPVAATRRFLRSARSRAGKGQPCPTQR